MVTSYDYEGYVKAAIDAQVDTIISGVGIPFDLPHYVKGSNSLVVPIIFSVKVAKLILKAWHTHENRIPDFIVIEAYKVRSYLSFHKEQLLNGICESNEAILAQVLKEIESYEIKYGKKFQY